MFQECVKRALHYAHSSVEVKLNGILAGIRATFGEINGVALVAKFTCVERAEIHIKRNPNLTKTFLSCLVSPVFARLVRRIRFFVRKRENGIGDAKRVLSGHAHYADTTCTYR